MRRFGEGDRDTRVVSVGRRGSAVDTTDPVRSRRSSRDAKIPRFKSKRGI